MEGLHQPIIPALPDDLALMCLSKLSHGYHGLLQCVSKKWRDLICSPEYSNYKAKQGWSGDWLFALTERSNNQWVAYDPDANRWHPLSRIYGTHDEREHTGFSCVCVFNRLLVIGGAYARHDSELFYQKPIVTNHVFQFDPYRKQWSRVASMRTPRSHFACCVISGKVYVAGGRNSCCIRGLALAEVYDPVTDKWEELPPMPHPQMDCIGLSFKGQFHIVSDQIGLEDNDASEVYDPSVGKWCIVEDTWPFSRAMQFAVQVMGDGRVYTIVDWGESLIKTRDTENGEWYNVGSVPSAILPDHCRPLQTFGYGFASLKNELYVIGGRALKWEGLGGGRFDIRRLNLVRVCEPSVMPLNWKELRSMCWPACGSILGCASMEENCSFR